MSQEDEAFLRLVQVTKRFGRQTVVDCVSLEVADGEVLALFGASGCGKTSTLRLVAGLETVDQGEIWLAGKCVAAAGKNVVPSRMRGIGFVFQDLALWPHLTVARSLDFVLEGRGMSKQERSIRIGEVLRLVHIESFAEKYPSQLSGGEQQRLALARALVSHPRLLLLDEPMSSLDYDLKTHLLRELAVLQQALHVTTIYVTHDREEAAAFAHRVVLMRGGRFEQVGTPDILRAQIKSMDGKT